MEVGKKKERENHPHPHHPHDPYHTPPQQKPAGLPARRSWAQPFRSGPAGSREDSSACPTGPEQLPEKNSYIKGKRPRLPLAAGHRGRVHKSSVSWPQLGIIVNAWAAGTADRFLGSSQTQHKIQTYPIFQPLVPEL